MEKELNSEPTLPERTPRLRDGYLLGGLMLMIFLPPFLPRDGPAILILRGLNLFLLLAAARAVIRSRREMQVIGGLLAFTAIMACVHWTTDDRLVVYGFLGGSIAFFSLVSAVLLSSLFRPAKIVSRDTLFGSISVYLLLGLIWALAYSVLEFHSPGSFTFTAALDPEIFGPKAHYQRFVGFSFITLTTLGYGHISPATPQADALTSAEAIIGQFFIAVVVARIVAMQLMQPQEE